MRDKDKEASKEHMRAIPASNLAWTGNAHQAARRGRGRWQSMTHFAARPLC